jgi:hypothetical protein
MFYRFSQNAFDKFYKKNGSVLSQKRVITTKNILIMKDIYFSHEAKIYLNVKPLVPQRVSARGFPFFQDYQIAFSPPCSFLFILDASLIAL